MQNSQCANDITNSLARDPSFRMKRLDTPQIPAGFELSGLLWIEASLGLTTLRVTVVPHVSVSLFITVMCIRLSSSSLRFVSVSPLMILMTKTTHFNINCIDKCGECEHADFECECAYFRSTQYKCECWVFVRRNANVLRIDSKYVILFLVKSKKNSARRPASLEHFFHSAGPQILRYANVRIFCSTFTNAKMESS